MAYLVRVSAENAAGRGPSSPAVEVTPGALSPAPTGLAVTVGDRALTATWDALPAAAPGGISSFTLTATPVAGGDPVTCTTAAAVPGCTVTALRSGLPYRVAVTAANALGSGPESTAVVATPGGPPGVPDGLVLVLADGLLSASWAAPADTGGAVLTGFTVTAVALPTPPPTSPAPADGTMPGGAAAGAAPVACAVPPATTACRLGPLHPGTTYQVSVTATNQFGTGDTAAPLIITTPSTSPAPGPTSAPAAADAPTATPASPSTSPSHHTRCEHPRHRTPDVADPVRHCAHRLDHRPLTGLGTG